ncbi:hypothetical protein ABZ215_10285 [Amycolatopsis sp. NPDC006131]|uniref:hypothetical protein n=1 Tax=Amycolatopsis sp. NPDC006131 TaxID=3156731 RepID=UPI0033B62A3E
MSINFGAVLAIAGLLAVAGCASERGYAVPDRVCGVPVDSAALAPLLPDGEGIGESFTDKAQGSVSCRLSVDGSTVLYLAADVTDRGTAAVSLDDDGLRRLGNPVLVDGAGDVTAVADRGAKAMAECTHAGQPRLFVGLVQSEAAQPRDVLLAFLASWFPAARAAAGC